MITISPSPSPGVDVDTGDLPTGAKIAIIVVALVFFGLLLWGASRAIDRGNGETTWR